MEKSNEKLILAIDITESHLDGFFASKFPKHDLVSLHAVVPIVQAFLKKPHDFLRAHCITHFGFNYPENRHGIDNRWLTDADPLWDKYAIDRDAFDMHFIKPNDHVINAPEFHKTMLHMREIVLCGFLTTCCISHAVSDISNHYPHVKITIPLDCIGARNSNSEKASVKISEWRRDGITIVDSWHDIV